MTQQLTLFDVLMYEGEDSPKYKIMNFVSCLDEERVKDAFGFSLVNVFFNEMTSYTSLYHLDAEERRIIGVRLQKTLEKHCDIPAGEVCDFLIGEVEVEFKVIPEQTKKHKDPKLAALGNRTVQSGKFTTGFVGPRQVGQHAVLGFYSEEGDLSHLDLGYCYLSTEALNKGMNRDKKRSISASVIHECRESNIIKRYTINRHDYIDKKYKKPK
jgi:hypothetical protein